MKKIFFTLIGVLLLSTTALGSDRVLYKMVVTSTGNANIDGKATIGESYEAIDISSYCFEIGSSSAPTYYNGGSTGQMVYRDTIRLAHQDSYMHISLSRALRAGDKIYVKSKRADKVFFNKTSERVRLATVGDDLTYTVTNSESGLKGATDLYMWKDNEHVYFHEILITTTSNEVVYYDFEDETTGDFTSSSNDLVNGLVAFCKTDDSSPKNGIVSKSSNGFSQMLYMKGNTKERSLKLTVSDPCTVEVWAIGSASGRKIYLTDNTNSMGKWTMGTFTDNSSLIKGTYAFTGTANSSDLYISSSEGAMHIAAVRVIYNKIRPASDLAVDIEEAVLQKGNNITITGTSSSDQTIKRANIDGPGLVNVTGSDAVGSASYIVAAKSAAVNSDLGYYKFKLYQSGSADYRPDTAYVSIRIVYAGESVADIDGTVAPKNANVWESNNITLIENSNVGDGIARYGAIGDFAANSSLRLANGRTFTLSVPSNKQIARLTISGYTSQEGTGSITPEGGSATQFNENGGDIKVIEYNDINAQKFTFAISGKNVVVKMDLVTSDLGHYPVTIGSSNWASFCAPEDMELPSGVYAYIAESKGKNAEDEDVVVVNKVEGSIIPAGGYLLYSETAGDYELKATTGAAALEGTNLLVGTSARTAKPATGTTYVLNSDGCLAPYTGNYIPANKAYLPIPADPAGAPKKLRIVVGHNMPTGIESAQNSTISSQKVIENGQLVIIKNGIRYNAQGQIVR